MLISFPLITFICCVAPGAGIFFTMDLFAFDYKRYDRYFRNTVLFFDIIESMFVYL